MLVLGAIVDQEQHAGCGEALNQAVQEGLGLGIDPVQVLEDQEQGLNLTLPEEQALDGLQGALAALWRIEGLPRLILDRHVQERQEGWEGWPPGLRFVWRICRARCMGVYERGARSGSLAGTAAIAVPLTQTSTLPSSSAARRWASMSSAFRSSRYSSSRSKRRLSAR